jgi:hypothetical protein
MKHFFDLRWTPTFYGLSLIFAFIGSCFIFIPPVIPREYLQNFGETVFPYTAPWAAEVFLNTFSSLGIEFYGGAILTFAFGVVEEREQLSKQKRDEAFTNAVLLGVGQIDQKTDELSLVLKECLANDALIESNIEQLIATSKPVKKNYWLWSLLFG